MAKEFAKSKNLKRSREDDKQPRSVKRKTTHGLQENGEERIDIDSSLKNKAQREFIQNMLELITSVVKKRKMSRYMNTVYHATAHLKEKISGKTLLQNSTCRFCAETLSCPLQPHNIISKGLPVEVNNEKVDEGENNEMKKVRRKR